jgi:hypothetical protein
MSRERCATTLAWSVLQHNTHQKLEGRKLLGKVGGDAPVEAETET